MTGSAPKTLWARADGLSAKIPAGEDAEGDETDRPDASGGDPRSDSGEKDEAAEAGDPDGEDADGAAPDAEADQDEELPADLYRRGQKRRTEWL